MKGLTPRTVIIGLAVVSLAAGSVLAMPGTDQATKDA